MKVVPFLKSKSLFLTFLLLAPLSAFADGHNMDGLIFYFFIIAGLLFVPLIVLTIIAGVYSSRPKKKTLQFYQVLAILVILFYLIIGVANYEMIEDLSNYLYLPILLFTFLAVINVMLIRSGYLARVEGETVPEQPALKVLKERGKIDKQLFLFVMIYFLLHFITTGINYFFPDWFGSGLKLLLFSIYFLNSAAFILVLMLIENRYLKITALLLWLIYIALQASEWIKFSQM